MWRITHEDKPHHPVQPMCKKLVSCLLPVNCHVPVWISWWIVVSDGRQDDYVIINLPASSNPATRCSIISFMSLPLFCSTLRLQLICHKWQRFLKIFHVLVIRFWNLFVIQLSVKQDFSPADLVHAPATTRCPLPPIEATKNGLPCSHGGKTGMDNGRAGWTSDHRLWFKPKPEIQTQTFSDRDNDAYRKGNFKWTIVGFVLAFTSLNSRFWAGKESTELQGQTGDYQIGHDSAQTNTQWPCETCPVKYAHDWALTCHSLWSGHHSARPFP